MKNQMVKIKNKKLFVIILIVALIFLALLSLCCGNIFVSPLKFFSKDFFLDNVISRIILYSRLPRIFGSFVAGSALAVAGYIIQTVLNNPLASPSVIGINSASGFFVALTCALFPMAINFMPLAAFVGALIGVFLVVLISEKTVASKITLVLSGIVVSLMFGAAIDAVLTFKPDSLSSYTDFRIGSLANESMQRIWPAFIIVFICIIIAITLNNRIDIMSLGIESASSVGLNVKATRMILLILAAAMVGSAVSFCGLLSAIGLIIPHIMRQLVGNEAKWMIPTSMLGGAIYLMFCDFLARIIFMPYEFPVGIILSLTGGPFFIWLLFKQRKGRTND